MKTKMKIRAGSLSTNHNLTMKSARRAKAWSMKIKTKLKAGALTSNHNANVKRAATARRCAPSSASG